MSGYWMTDADVATTKAAEAPDWKSYATNAQRYLDRPTFKGTPVRGEYLANSASNTFARTNKLIPLDLALSQGQIESKFGTTGRSPVNNPYNIGEYDDGTKLTFKSPQEGIQKYYDVMAKDYLAEGRTVPNLLTNFVNTAGNRYASSKEYESLISKQMRFINKFLNRNEADIKPDAHQMALRNAAIAESDARIAELGEKIRALGGTPPEMQKQNAFDSAQYLLLGTGVAADLGLRRLLSKDFDKQFGRTPKTYGAYAPRIYGKMGLDKNFPTFAVRGYGNSSFVQANAAKEFADTMYRSKVIDEPTYKRILRKGMVLYDPRQTAPATLAHEAGHAIIGQRPWYSPSRAIQGPLRGLSDMANVAKVFPGMFVGAHTGSPALGMLTGALSGTAANLPAWINEFQASSLANKYIKEHVPKHKDPREQQRLLRKAYATYLLPALLIPTLYGGLSGAYSKFKGRK